MALDDRKKQILQAIVEDYISTAEPVGSRSISAVIRSRCSSTVGPRRSRWRTDSRAWRLRPASGSWLRR